MSEIQKYSVAAVVAQRVYVEVHAESPEEAIFEAGQRIKKVEINAADADDIELVEVLDAEDEVVWECGPNPLQVYLAEKAKAEARGAAN
jgi:hypothetical protein